MGVGTAPPNNHPSCADGARYVRGTARPIQITARPPTPSCSRSPGRARVGVRRAPRGNLDGDIDSGWTAGPVLLQEVREDLPAARARPVVPAAALAERVLPDGHPAYFLLELLEDEDIDVGE